MSIHVKLLGILNHKHDSRPLIFRVFVPLKAFRPFPMFSSQPSAVTSIAFKPVSTWGIFCAELWDIIIEEIHREGLSSYVRPFAEVNSHFLRLAHQRTFRKVVFANEPGRRETTMEMRQWLGKFGEFLSREDRTWLARMVQEVEVFLGRPGHLWLQSPEFKDIVAEIARAGKTTKLSIVSGSTEPVHYGTLATCAFQELGKNLAELFLANVDRLDVGDMLTHIPRIRKLSLAAVDCRDYSRTEETRVDHKERSITSFTYTPRSPSVPMLVGNTRSVERDLLRHMDLSLLEEVDLRAESTQDTSFSIAVLHAGTLSLRSLKLNVMGVLSNRERWRNLRAYGLKLERIHLWAEFGERWTYEGSPVDACALALRSLYTSALKELRIEVRYFRLDQFAQLVSENVDWEDMDNCIQGHRGKLRVYIHMNRRCTFERSTWRRQVEDRLVGNRRFKGIDQFSSGGLVPCTVERLLPMSRFNKGITFEIIGDGEESMSENSWVQWEDTWS
ncbi:hypothetical protein CC2G_004095 [Coprinopsis cinerea AmutBmut pab1-1]|nr:hypothetical protein CC2G_004095 [Coprinopsis cinerea AmutBmut pab1-1]